MPGLPTSNRIPLRRINTPSIVALSPHRGYYNTPQWVRVEGYGFVESPYISCRFFAENGVCLCRGGGCAAGGQRSETRSTGDRPGPWRVRRFEWSAPLGVYSAEHAHGTAQQRNGGGPSLPHHRSGLPSVQGSPTAKGHTTPEGAPDCCPGTGLVMCISCVCTWDGQEDQGSSG